MIFLVSYSFQCLGQNSASGEYVTFSEKYKAWPFICRAHGPVPYRVVHTITHYKRLKYTFYNYD